MGSQVVSLIVDDEESIVRLIGACVGMLGWRAVKAHSGPEALTLARNLPGPLVLITDIDMPEMSGFELERALSESHPGTRTLFISGTPVDCEAVAAASRRRIARFLGKPFVVGALLAALMDLASAQAGEHAPVGPAAGVA